MSGNVVALTAAVAMIALPAFAADTSPRLAVPYTATQMVTGHVEMGIGVLSGSGSGSTDGLFTAAGRANKILWHGWNMELEAGGAGIFGSSSTANGVFSGYGHFWYMATPGHAFGLFGGAAFASGATVTTLGLEGKAHLGPLSIAGEVADNFATGGGGSFWLTGLSAASYLNSNTRIGIGATFVGGNGLGLANTGTVVTADAEHRFFDPISAWGSLSYITGGSGGGGNAWAGLVGLRIFAEAPGGSLRAHDDIVPWHFNNALRAY